jgi:flagella basal body P-ring formation protein FlgA
MRNWIRAAGVAFASFLVISLAVVAIPLATSPSSTGRGGVIISAGDAVRVVVDAGAVHIERKAVAIQAARQGQHLFVKTTDGEVISARAESTL